jgi:hypothetical protein
MNQYPGYCIDCQREVKRGHGDLKKRNGKYVVSCGRGATSKPAVISAPKPKPERPTGNRLSDLRITSQNATLSVGFAVDGIGYAMTYAPFQNATGIKYKRWSNEPLSWTDKPEDKGKSLREIRPDEAIAHDASCGANEALLASLKSKGQITCESDHEFTFFLSLEEETLCAKLISDTKAACLAAILDGTATVQVHEIGCDFPHMSVGSITLPGAEKPLEFSLSYDLLVTDLRLKLDGQAECKDLAGAIRERQAKIAEKDAEKEAHKLKRANGYHLVAIKRCWECGRTKILGELDDNFHLVRMSESVYAECIGEQRKGHERSLATVPAGTMLSSIGFDPDPASTFEFRCIENDWYCGC